MYAFEFYILPAEKEGIQNQALCKGSCKWKIKYLKYRVRTTITRDRIYKGYFCDRTISEWLLSEVENSVGQEGKFTFQSCYFEVCTISVEK